MNNNMVFKIKNPHIKAFKKSKHLNALAHQIAMEECAELSQAISKRGRGKQDKNDNLIEEMADVLIYMDLIMQLHDISDKDIQKVIDEKRKRFDDRMKSKKFS